MSNKRLVDCKIVIYRNFSYFIKNPGRTCNEKYYFNNYPNIEFISRREYIRSINRIYRTGNTGTGSADNSIAGGDRRAFGGEFGDSSLSLTLVQPYG
jgi:hypothetical protein